ncbi:copine-3-like [Actinia tenebrosa]|uniref:Copine-3 n=1 Tax=Actinia tenebrosa TaxID=6105 RepID=A0A6P8J042_ACTTE|nr:copine-3-like [Actinia tenebrosa]
MEQTQCVTKVELHISCRGLIDKDVLSKSDPIAVLLMQDKDGRWFEYARTEHVKNNLNPDFSKSISLDYYFEMVQKLKFTVYDVDNESTDLDDDDFLGGMECTLGQVVSKKTFTKELEIKEKKAGTITVFAEEVSGTSDRVKIAFTAKNLDNKDFLSKSDPFLEISRMKSDGGFVLVHRTEVIDNNLNPIWKPFEMTVNSLCGGDYDAKLKIDVYDYDEGDTNDFIGSTETTLKGLLDAHPEGKSFELINPKKKQKKKNYVNSGQLLVNNCEIVRIYSFLEYVMGGCQLNFSVGVDFTLSNGDPTEPHSLHYMKQNKPNEYIKALTSVGEICQDYDTDKLFPAFGFGADIPPKFQTSHAFPLNFNPANPQCEGIIGVVAAYKACLAQIELSAPTNTAPIIQQVAELASEASRQTTASQYFVLLILTDGVLSDMAETKYALVCASYLPMSVIIVGVGSANFSKMEELDADDGLLSVHGKVADRDIVQFVPFRDFEKKSPALLAQHVLAEVPKQVQEYFNKRKIPPLNPKGPSPPSLDAL